MGLLFSCCRRRKDQPSDRDPLLPKDRVAAGADHALPSERQLTQFADAIAALKSGKLPSQDQITRILQWTLRSDLLSSTNTSRSYGTLSQSGTRVLESVRDVVDALLQFGLEKNDDDIVQELLYQFHQLPATPVHADIIVDAAEGGSLDVQDLVEAIPSKDEAASDATEVVAALKTLSTVFISSSAFRLLLSDVLTTAREVFADAAANIAEVAAVIETSATKLEEVIRPEGGDAKACPVPEADSVHVAKTGDDVTPQRTKETVVSRLQEIIMSAHKNPRYQQALQSILDIVRKYAAIVDTTTIAVTKGDTPTITPVIWSDSHLATILSLLERFIPRVASRRPLDGLLGSLRLVAQDLARAPSELTDEDSALRELRACIQDLGDWLDVSLNDAAYASSPAAKAKAGSLYDRLRSLVDEARLSDRPWAHHIRTLFHETELYLDALHKDRTTHRLIDSLSLLSSSFSDYSGKLVRNAPGEVAASAQRFRAQVQRDILHWFLPRLLRALHVIPMPRVEYVSGVLDAAIDALYLRPSSMQFSLVPDRIRISNWTEVQLDIVELDSQATIPNVEAGAMNTISRLRVDVDGVRVSARDVGYYVCYRPFGRNRWLDWLGYEDEGLLSVDVGGRGERGEGLSFNVELEFASDDDGRIRDNQDDVALFRASQVHVTVPGLQLALDRSKHWILNRLFLQPLAGPVGRPAAGWVLRGQLEAVLEYLSRLGGNINREARLASHKAQKDVELSDYMDAFWRVISAPVEAASSTSFNVENDADAAQDVLPTETHTGATSKGILRTTLTYPTDASSEAGTPVDESVLAIGIGAQVLPGKGGPHNPNDVQDESYGPRELAQEALGEVQQQVDNVVQVEEVLVDRSVQARQDLDNAAGRERHTERVEARRAGWRSRAFDL